MKTCCCVLLASSRMTVREVLRYTWLCLCSSCHLPSLATACPFGLLPIGLFLQTQMATDGV